MTSTQAAAPYALMIQPDGWFELADWASTWTAAADSLSCQAVRPVALTGQLTMWVDEDAVPRGLPFNYPAARVLRVFRAEGLSYFGPVLFTGRIDNAADRGAYGLTEDQALELIEQYLTRAAKIPQQRTR
ncbi:MULTISPECIES: DUF3846 domain-containing protein [unclassified Streptomyces]|uniref:DUF3846 domain-containing protein n=1 Tax=unclassified Streptomyces TaxID=2593676 RepID=UPI00064D1382|nr:MULTISPECIES: DUF3846 domain-containing protein [unclassified Streptomyces]AKL64122.1 hypothetical protein M444_00030 [Streptomyces sp. Mg1]RPK44856.1 hypothetical protein EES37_15840 [Streptomyces sp. ADI91-18]